LRGVRYGRASPLAIQQAETLANPNCDKNKIPTDLQLIEQELNATRFGKRADQQAVLPNVTCLEDGVRFAQIKKSSMC